jgi:hypothetical protein
VVGHGRHSPRQAHRSGGRAGKCPPRGVHNQCCYAPVWVPRHRT